MSMTLVVGFLEALTNVVGFLEALTLVVGFLEALTLVVGLGTRVDGMAAADRICGSSKPRTG